MAAAGLPAIEVSPLAGRFLALLVRIAEKARIKVLRSAIAGLQGQPDTEKK